MEPKFVCTTVETQRDFLEVAYKISFLKNAMLPCGIVLLIMGLWGLTWPGIRSVIGYRKALKTYGGAIRPSTVTFGEKIVNDTPNGIMEMPYSKVKTIHFLKNSFVIEDDRGVGVLVSKNGFGDVPFMDCVNFLCEQCSNLEL